MKLNYYPDTDSLYIDRVPDRFNQTGRDPMARPQLRIWFDPKADFLEVLFEQREGFFRATANDHVMEKVDQDGKVLGFSILRVSALQPEPLTVAL